MSMKRILYLGTDPTWFKARECFQGDLIHYPVIKIVPRAIDHPEIRSAYADLDHYTHLLFTSKNAVKVFFDHLLQMNRPISSLHNRTVIAIGEVTAAHLASNGLVANHVSLEETQEGVVSLLQDLNLDDAYVFLPRSSLSRPLLVHYLETMQIPTFACDFYDTVPQMLEPRPNLDKIDEIVFTSPSTVQAFLAIFGALPRDKKCIAIGPITESFLQKSMLVSGSA
jgi:uroporphyrinogen-III synthase